MCTFSWHTEAFGLRVQPFQFVTKVPGLVSSMAEIVAVVVVPLSASSAASALTTASCIGGTDVGALLPAFRRPAVRRRSSCPSSWCWAR